MSQTTSKHLRVKLFTERPMGRKVAAYLRSCGDKVVTKNPDIGIIAYYGRILKKEEIDTIPMGILNFHPGYLPKNRGMYPHIWPLVDGSPAGVTIHYINEGIDEGDIIAQERVPVYPTDIATDLEKRTQEAILELFKKTWLRLKQGKVRRRKQKGPSSHHYAKEITTIQEFDKKTIMRLRACTFKDRSYGFYREGKKKIYVGAKFFTQKDIDKFNKRHYK